MVVGSLGLSVFFGFLGHLSLYLAFFQVITSDYIRFDILPRARRCLEDTSITPYGWEEYLWEQRKDSWLMMSAYFISEGALFVLPSLAFASYGFWRLRALHGLSGPGIAACAVFTALLAWLAFAGIRTAWAVMHSERRFRKRQHAPHGEESNS